MNSPKRLYRDRSEENWDNAIAEDPSQFSPGTSFDVYELVDSGRVFEERKIIIKYDSDDAKEIS